MKVILAIAILASTALTERSMPLYGNSTIGYYYIEAFVGSPPQKKALILDTGSHLTTFPCKGCSNCNDHTNGLFDPSKSATFQPLKHDTDYFGWKCPFRLSKKCNFQQTYVEGSEYKGFYAIDNFLFKNELPLQKEGQNYQHIFGCSTVETGDFFDQEADGIIGFGVPMTSKSESIPPTIIDIEFMEKRTNNRSFALCIAPNGGSLTIGSSNSLLHLKNSQKIAIDCSQMDWSGQYQAYLSGISVD